jgi:hypothetical protein
MTSQATEIKSTKRYEGHGSAEFGTPMIRAEGPTVVNTDERGITTATMQVEKVPTAASIDEGMTILFRDVFNNMNKRTPCSLQVECSDGIFSATEQTFREPSVDVPNQKATIEFRCFRSFFDTGSRHRCPHRPQTTELRRRVSICHDRMAKFSSTQLGDAINVRSRIGVWER